MISEMDYQLTSNSAVLRLDDGAFIPMDLANSDYQDYLAWVAAGNKAQPVAAPTLAELSASLEQAVQQWLDQTAQANGYADMNTCVSYYNSSVAQWAADAKAGSAWRDAVWQQCYTLENDPAAQASPPTASQLIASLPQPATYSWTTHAPGAT